MNSIAGRGNRMCKGGVAMQSVSGECVQLLCSGSIRARAETMSGGHTKLSVWFYSQGGKRLWVLKQGFSMILLWLERGLELTRTLEVNGVTWEGTRMPEPDLSPGELETCFPSCPSLNICSTGFHLGGFCLQTESLSMSGDSFSCQNQRGELLTSNGQKSGRLLSTRQRTRLSSTAKNYSAQNINGAMVENPELQWFGQNWLGEDWTSQSPRSLSLIFFFFTSFHQFNEPVLTFPYL